MRYGAVVVGWLALSALWGIAGAWIGPGAVMIIVASIVGGVGALATVAQLAAGRGAPPLASGALVFVTAFVVAWVLLGGAAVTDESAVFLAGFIAVPSFGGSFLMSRGGRGLSRG